MARAAEARAPYESHATGDRQAANADTRQPPDEWATGAPDNRYPSSRPATLSCCAGEGLRPGRRRNHASGRCSGSAHRAGSPRGVRIWRRRWRAADAEPVARSERHDHAERRAPDRAPAVEVGHTDTRSRADPFAHAEDAGHIPRRRPRRRRRLRGHPRLGLHRHRSLHPGRRPSPRRRLRRR